MDSCSSCTTNSANLYCSDCKGPYCGNCAIVKHLSDSFVSHTIANFCEECEEEPAVILCENCDQTLCLDCDARIHNKGKRAQHVKKNLSETAWLGGIINLVYLTSSFCQQHINGEKASCKIVDLLSDMSQKAGNDTENTSSLVILEAQKNSSESLKLAFDQALKDSKFKNMFVINDNAIDLKNFGQKESEEGRALMIASILKHLKGVSSVFIYDIIRNEDLGQALERMAMKDKKVFLNFANTERDIETSLYVPKDDAKPSASPKADSEMSDDSFGESPFARNAIKNSTADFSRQDSSFNNSCEGVQRPKVNYETLCSKENIQPNQRHSEVKKNLIPFAQPLKHVEIQGLIRAGELLQQELIKFAETGELLVLRETLLSKMMEALPLRSLQEADNVLIEAENRKLIHTTVRKFLYNGPFYYIGMLLNQLTIESLTWVIKSIKSDLMTPTEKLVQSRIKECYGLKIDQPFWKLMLNQISNKKDFGSNTKNFRNKNINACPLYVKQILDPVTNTETNAIYLANDEWVPEDQGSVDEASEEWKTFLAFIENFFKEEPQATQGSQERYEADENAKGSRWSNSVENVLNRSVYDTEKCLKVSDDVKAIPGGRYGCAQFIKYCGPDNLKELSIGRLTLLVQEAINKGVLRYQRTLLVKNTTNDSITSLPNASDFESEVLHSLNNERRTKILSMVKEALLEILMENAEGVSLAQIPFHLKRKLKFVVDFEELGYPKLKNFLSTLKNLVVIQSVGTNHTFVKLKGPIPMTQTNNLSKNQVPKKRCGDIDNSAFSSNQIFRNHQSQPQPQLTSNISQPQRMEDPNAPNKFLNNDVRTIQSKLDFFAKQNPNGIKIEDLEMRLSEFLKTPMFYKAFGYGTFYEFLVEFGEQVVDIQAVKGGFIIYPKSSSLWAKGGSQVPPGLNLPGTRPVMMPTQKYESLGKPLRSGGFSCEDSGIMSENPRGLAQANRNDQFYRATLAPSNKNMALSFSHSLNTSSLSTSFPSQNAHNKTGNESVFENSNLFNVSRINCMENTELLTPFDKRGMGMENNNLNTSNWSLNFHPGVGSGNGEFRDHITGLPQQSGPKVLKKSQFQKFHYQEESHLEIQENLKFIEELLQDGHEENNRSNSNYGNRSNSNLSLGGFYTPNQSFNRKPMSRNMNQV